MGVNQCGRSAALDTPAQWTREYSTHLLLHEKDRARHWQIDGCWLHELFQRSQLKPANREQAHVPAHAMVVGGSPPSVEDDAEQTSAENREIITTLHTPREFKAAKEM